MSKIALIKAGMITLFSPRDEPPREPELRYTLWEKRPADPHAVQSANVVLLYEDQSLEQILRQARYGFYAEDEAAPSFHVTDTGMSVKLHPITEVPLGDISVTALGEYDGYACYVIQTLDIPSTSRRVDLRYSVTHMPGYGRARVVYQPNTVRETFDRVNVTNTMIPGDDPMRRLFEFMDSRVHEVLGLPTPA